MAPVNGTSGSDGNVTIRKVGATRRRNVTPVVPAIPLPYMQKRLQKRAVSKTPPPPTPASAPTPTPAPAPAPSPMPKSSPSQPQGDIRATPKGVYIHPVEPEAAELDSSKEVEQSVVTSPGAVAQPSSAQDMSSTLNDSSSEVTKPANPSFSVPSGPEEPRPVSETSSSDPNQPAETHLRDPVGPQYEMSRQESHRASPEHLNNHLPDVPRPETMNAIHQANSLFYPGADMNRTPEPLGQGLDGYAGSHQGSIMHAPAAHQPHHSTNNLTFGGIHDSNNSSPAPLSAGYGPPPGFPTPNGGSHMGRPSGPDFRPQSFVYGNNMDPATNIDHFAQPMAAYAPHDGGYHPFIGNYMPATPLSYHGSQPSPQPEDSGLYGVPNGVHGHFEDGPPRIRASMYGMVPPPGMMPPMPPPHLFPRPIEPDFEQILDQLKRHFQDPRLADCRLELSFPDQRAGTLSFPAHRLVLAQSKTLEQLMMDNPTGRRKHGSGSTITVRAVDKYLRSDAFLMAVQRLYGFPLFEIPVPPSGAEDLPLAGGAADQFKFVISYAAAGHLLQHNSVVVRGMEMGSQLVSWDTVELALEFALGSSPARGTIDFHEKWHYGGATKILYDGVVAFVSRHLHTEFELDFAVSDPDSYCRLPNVPDLPKGRTNAKTSSPAIARGSVVKLGPNHRSRLSKIKFGDLSTEDARSGANGITKRGQPYTQDQIAILSKILLNLPFESVKSILESPRFGMDAESVAARDEARFRLITDVVSEREARRLAVLEAVKASQGVKADQVRRTLSSIEPRTVDECSVLGFQETVTPVSDAGVPYISRAWVPLAISKKGNSTGNSGHGRFVAAYP